MTIHYAGHGVQVHAGDCLDVLAEIGDATVDSVVTDPPYGLEFMGKEWDRFGGDARQRDDATFTAGDRRHGLVRHGIGASYGGDTGKAMRAYQAWCQLWAAECLRVLKPGGHLLAFGGTRTSHRLATAIEDAGFEIRDSIVWLYGSGFPKSLDVSKAIDRRRDWSLVERLSAEIRRARAEAGLSLADIGQATLAATGNTYGKWYHRGGHMFFETGRSLPSRPEWERLRRVLPIAPEFVDVYDEAEREVLRETTTNRDGGSWAEQVDSGMFQTGERIVRTTAPATDAARKWQGWGTALKPAHEPIVVARKPLTGTVAANVLAHGTGALNIGACRVGEGEGRVNGGPRPSRAATGGFNMSSAGERPTGGRWPANVVLSHADDCGDTVCAGGCPVATLDKQSGELHSQDPATRYRASDPSWSPSGTPRGTHQERTQATGADSGGASRFFYTAKASTAERVRLPQADAPDHRAGNNFAGGIRVCNVCANRTKPGNWVPGDPRPWPGCGHDDWQWGTPNVQTGNVAHPTVKPLSLLQWLVRLVTPPGGLVLDPFAGSGTTAEAALLEGFRCITIERELDYLPLIVQRINRRRDPVAATRATSDEPSLFDLLEGA